MAPWVVPMDLRWQSLHRRVLAELKPLPWMKVGCFLVGLGEDALFLYAPQFSDAPSETWMRTKVVCGKILKVVFKISWMSQVS